MADLTEHEGEYPGTERRKSAPAITIVIYSWMTPLIGVIMLILGALGGFLIRPLLVPEAAPASAEAAGATVASNVENPNAAEIMQLVTQQTRHFMGREDAPVTIVEFSDFQCPYCGSFAATTGRQIIAQYVQTGKVRFGYIHFPFLGPASTLAAQASECAAEQDAFWDYHDLVFENQDSINATRLKELAGDLGLNQQTFDACLDSGKYEAVVNSQGEFSQSIGVRSTPSFLINGQPLIGAQGFEVFRQVIEAELESANP